VRYLFVFALLLGFAIPRAGAQSGSGALQQPAAGTIDWSTPLACSTAIQKVTAVTNSTASTTGGIPQQTGTAAPGPVPGTTNNKNGPEGKPNDTVSDHPAGGAAMTATMASTPYGSPQSIVNLTMTGSGFGNFGDIEFCYKAAEGVYLNNPQTPFLRFNEIPPSHKFPATSIAGTVSILPSAVEGTYGIFLSDGKSLTDTKLTFTVRQANNGQYSDCSTKQGTVTGNQSLFCSQALLDYQQTYRIFGKGIADQYIAVEVTVRNLSDDYEYILHDIRLGGTDAVVASIDKKLVRAVGENTEQFTARAIAVRLTEAAATAFTGIAGIVGNNLLTSVSALTAGPALLGLKHAIPDLSVAELNRINDLAFSTGGIIVSKHAAVPVVAFLSSKIFVPQCDVTVPSGSAAGAIDINALKSVNPLTICHTKIVDINFKDLKTQDLMTLQKGLIVEVSGAHVQEIAALSVTTVTGSPNELPLDKSKVTGTDKEIITLQGTGLDTVTQVNLVATGGATHSFPVDTSTAATAGRTQFTMTGSQIPAAGVYSITLDTATQKGVKSGQSLTISAASSLQISTPQSFTAAIGATSTAQTVTVSNDTSTDVTALSASFSGASATDFSSMAGASNPCGTTLAKDAKCTYDLKFSPGPTGADPRSASFYVKYGTDSASAQVTGTATKPSGTVVFWPTTITCPAATSGVVTCPALTVANYESSSVTISGLPSNKQFTTGSACASIAASSAPCMIQITFTPNSMAESGTASWDITYKVGNTTSKSVTIKLIVPPQ
jgi:hypothetical protein